MQSKRSELIPVGKIIGGLSGPVQAIREASPQAQRHFTQADQVNQLVSASELALLLLLFILPSCAARHIPDWSRVQAVPPKTKTEVQLYKDEAPQGSRKIKGRFESSTDGSIMLKLKDGQTRTLEKQAVRKVLTRRPFWKRWPGWAAFGITFTLLESHFRSDGAFTPAGKLRGHAIVTFPIAAAFFYGSRMGGIYEVPLEHRTPPSGGQQSGAQSQAPGKPEDSRRD